MTETMTITFWGVRGTHPTPGPMTVRYGGNTPCVEVTAGEQTIILDAGTGIIALGRELARRAAVAGRPIEATLLFSHLHHDHTQGFPFFAPTRFPTTRLHIFAPDLYEQEPETLLTGTMGRPTFPIGFRDLAASCAVYSLRETDTIRWVAGRTPFLQPRAEAGGQGSSDEVVIRAMRSYAHPDGVLIYRIEWKGRSVVYATDTEGYVAGDRRLIAFARGADLLIHDAQYSEAHYLGRLSGYPTTQGWGHSTPTMACEVARAAGVRQVAFFHYDPTYSDQAIAEMESRARTRFAPTLAPHEGLQITLPAQGSRLGTAPLLMPRPVPSTRPLTLPTAGD